MNINELIQKFHPVFWFYSKEKYFPVDPRDYIRLCSLYKDDTVLVPYPDLKPSHLTDSKIDPSLVNFENRNGSFYLKMDDTPEKLEKYREGNKDFIIGSSTLSEPYPSKVPLFVYTQYINTESTTFIDIVFLLHFSYNGTLSPHDYDVEYVTVRVNTDTQQVHKVYMSSHGGGSWISPNNMEMFQGSHPTVYVASHSHALYHRPGVFERMLNFGSDYTDKGYFWDASVFTVLPKRIEDLHESLRYLLFVGRRAPDTGLSFPPYQHPSSILSLDYDCPTPSLYKMRNALGGYEETRTLLWKLNLLMIFLFVFSVLSFVLSKHSTSSRLSNFLLVLGSVCMSFSVIILMVSFFFGYTIFDLGFSLSLTR